MNKGVLHIVNFLLTIPGALITAFVFLKYWQWFAVPFIGLQALSFKGALAITFLVGILRYSSAVKEAMADETEVDDLIKNQLWMYLCAYPIALLIGWLWHMALS